MEWLIVRAAGRDLALDVRRVREILAAALVTPVPLAPRSLRGLAPIRGQPVTVVDLAVRLGADRAPPGRRSPIVVVDARVDGNAATVALLVEDAGRLVESQDVLPRPASLDGDAELCTGFLVVDGALVPILDVDAAVVPGTETAPWRRDAGSPTTSRSTSRTPTPTAPPSATPTPAHPERSAAAGGAESKGTPSPSATPAHPERSAAAGGAESKGSPSPSPTPAHPERSAAAGGAESKGTPTATATATATPAAPATTPSPPSIPRHRAPDRALLPATDACAPTPVARASAPLVRRSRRFAAAGLAAMLVLLGAAATLLRGAAAVDPRARSAVAAAPSSSSAAVPAIGAAPAAPAAFARYGEAPPARAEAAGRARAMPPPPAAAPAACDLHRVVRGDTLWALAAARFGDPLRWREIHRANLDVLTDPDRLLPGKRLRIPDRCDATRGR